MILPIDQIIFYIKIGLNHSTNTSTVYRLTQFFDLVVYVMQLKMNNAEGSDKPYNKRITRHNESM